MGGAELYAANAAEMWASLAPVRGDLRRSPGMVVVEIPAQRATRTILRQRSRLAPGGSARSCAASAEPRAVR
jgi:hypothetical protein